MRAVFSMRRLKGCFNRIAPLSALVLLTVSAAYALDATDSTAALTLSSSSAHAASQTAPSTSAGSGSDEKAATTPKQPHKFFPYTVRTGDSLGSVAQYFGVPAADLARINRIKEEDDRSEEK